MSLYQNPFGHFVCRSDPALAQEGWEPPELLSAGFGVTGDVCFA